MKQDFLEVGKIVGTHGVRGMLRVEPWCDDAAFFCRFGRFILSNRNELAVERSAPHGNIALMKVAGIDTVEQAETLRGKVLSVRREEAKLPEGRWFVSELMNSEVYDKESGKLLGTLTDVFKTGANDVWQITDNGKDYLVPAIESVIESVDIDNGKIVIDPMKGIFDDAD